MSGPDWDCVRLGDGITASGQVCEIHEREDGLTVFVIRDAKLIEHRPKPRPKFVWGAVATTPTTGIVSMLWRVTTSKGTSHD